MVAKPDFKSGFETDSNPDLTKNYDPVWNPVFRFKSSFYLDVRFQTGLKTSFQIQIQFEIQISDQNRIKIKISDQTGLKSRFQIPNRFEIWI